MAWSLSGSLSVRAQTLRGRADAIFHEGHAVALTIGCGYGHRVGKLIASSCLPVELTAPGTALEVEVLGARVPCRVVSMPLYRRTA